MSRWPRGAQARSDALADLRLATAVSGARRVAAVRGGSQPPNARGAPKVLQEPPAGSPTSPMRRPNGHPFCRLIPSKPRSKPDASSHSYPLSLSAYALSFRIQQKPITAYTSGPQPARTVSYHLLHEPTRNIERRRRLRSPRIPTPARHARTISSQPDTTSGSALLSSSSVALQVQQFA